MSVTMVVTGPIGPAIEAFEAESEVHVELERMTREQQTAVLLFLAGMTGTHVTGSVTLGDGGSVKVDLTGYDGGVS